jgi:hypothetical protein
MGSEALVGRSCAVCGDRIDMDEQIVVLSGGVYWRTSLARDPHLTAADILMHEKCAPISLDQEEES